MAAVTTDGTDQDSAKTADHNGADGTGEMCAEARAPPPDSRQEPPGDGENGAEMDVNGGHGDNSSPGPNVDKETVTSTQCVDSDGKTRDKLCGPPGESPGPNSLASSTELQLGEQREQSVSCPPNDCTKTGEKPAEPGTKRRASVEISSSDGEPLSRMDSEDSISSTLMDAESGASSGRSTPAMMNGHGGVGGGGVGPVGAGPVPGAIGPPGAGGVKPVPGYTCCWDHCHLQNPSSPDLAEHIRATHVDGQRGGVFVCLWKGCKVYNTPSTSHSWLQRHMLTHSGDKPFKCVVGGCNATFASQGGLARHVPTHFSSQGSSRLGGHGRLKEESPSKAGLNKRRKLKSKRRRSLPRPHDFFDAQTMDAIRHRAICLNLATHIESLGNGHSAVFHSTVIARRKEESGKVKLLLHWSPEDILPDVWVNESDRQQQKTKVVHLSKLPTDTALLLDPNIYRMFF
ncbi:unnamed protein product [Lota lota]